MREITPDETGILYECMEYLGDHHNEVSVYLKGLYPTIPSDEIVRMFKEELEQGTGFVAVIEENQTVIAFCKITIDSKKHTGTIDYLCVLPGEHGKGYGHALMDWAFRKFDEYQIRDIEGKVVYGNDVVDFYRQYGFREKSVVLFLRR